MQYLDKQAATETGLANSWAAGNARHHGRPNNNCIAFSRRPLPEETSPMRLMTANITLACTALVAAMAAFGVHAQTAPGSTLE